MKNMKSHVEILSPDEILLIHQAALRILSRTGFHMPHLECLKRCEKAGAKVDYVTEVVRIPVELMEETIRLLRPATPPDVEHTPKLSGGISTQVFVTDYVTKTRRYGTMDDNLKNIALLDHLRNIPGCNAATVPHDIDSRISDVATYNMLLKYSAKAGGTYVINPATAGFIMDMGEAMDRREFYLFETISPLRFRRETCEMGLAFADRGHHLGLAPMIVGGTTGPATMAGTLSLVCAEVLASLFSIYAISGKHDGWFGHGSHFSDPRTMLCSFGSPVQAMIAVASAQMARFYGFQAGSNSALSDSLMPDFQCGFEKTFSAVMGGLAGTVSIGCQGIAGADQGFSAEQLVLDNEWLDAYNFVVSGFVVDAEQLATELIEEVGIGGNFIAEEHTAEHTRESWWPSTLFSRDSFDAWQALGAPSSLERAHAKVEEYTSGYRDRLPVIPPAKADELDRILEAAKRHVAAG
jgi:trimethylamine--corrinoid protein Co-methyltransferase